APAGPAVAAWLSPAFTAICVAVPAVPVAVNVTGLSVMPVAVAVSVFGPAVVPSVHEVTVAIPLLPVVTGVVGLTVPPPDATVKVTARPATGLLNWSRTITDGSVVTAVPAVALWLFPALIAIELAAAALTVTVAVCVTVTEPFTVAATVFVPAAVELRVPVICPLPLVVPTGCVSVFPVVGAAVSVTVAPLTGLLLASRTVTVIVEALVPSLAVIVPGAAATLDCPPFGPPAVPVAVNVTGDPAPVAWTVCVPAWGPNVQVVAAMPLALVVDVVGVTDPLPLAGVQVTVTPATGLLN